MNKIKSAIPSFITSLGLFSGSLACVFAIDGQLGWAGLFILIAAVFDFLDGIAARALRAISTFGKELDSLADVISFGIAPGLILFTLLEYSLFKTNQPIQTIEGKWYEWLILFSAFLIPIFGALRLAKFNIAENQTNTFKGLPIPANAILWASFGLMLEFQDHQELLKLLFTTKNLVFLAVVISGLMVSDIPMFSFKMKGIRWKGNWFRYVFLGITIILLVVLKVLALPVIILAYILFSILLYLLKIDF